MIGRLAKILCASIILIGFNPPADAGSLEPPGPPGPTFKTLGEIEARQAVKANTEVVEAIVIDQPGSYYLVENILAIPNYNAITINANNVTLDLNGFTVSGNNEVTDGHGIWVAGENVTIRNGTVRNADENGITCSQHNLLLKLFNVNAINNAKSGVVCSDMQVSGGDFTGNGKNGVGGARVLIDNVRASNNTSSGVNLGGRSLLTRALVNDNTFWGVVCIQGISVVTQTIAVGNDSAGDNINIGGCQTHDSYAP